MSTRSEALRGELLGMANEGDAKFLQGYFRTGPGEYGEGDRFLGVRVPQLRRLSKQARDLSLAEVTEMLGSEWHEERLLSLLILVERYRRADESERQDIHRVYLANTRFINNWDLVDVSAPSIVGPHVDLATNEPLIGLSASESVWERRIAMMATFHWIRLGVYGPALEVATRLLHDPHDLVHKAVGWGLREIGKQDRGVEEAFLLRHYKEMPRTALRYAIEHFAEERRKDFLRGRA